MDRTGTTEGQQGVATHIAPVLHRMDLGRAGHVFADDAMNTVGGLDHAHAQRLGDVFFDGTLGQRRAQADRATERALAIEIAQ